MLGFLNLSRQGKEAEAEPYYLLAHAIIRRVLGEDHPLTALTCDNIGQSLQIGATGGVQ